MGRRVLAAIACAGLLGPGSARAEEPDRVGLVVGVRVNVAEERAAEIARAMARVLERELAVTVTTATGAELERELPRRCATDSVCLAGLAARVEVEELLFLVLVGAGDRVRVELTRRHPVTGELSHPPAIILEPEPDRRDRQIAGVVGELLPDAAPRRPEPAPPPPSAEPPASEPVDRVDPRAGQGKRRAGLITAAAGLALASGGLVFALRARSAADQLSDRHPPEAPGTWTAEDEALENRHHRDRSWAAVLGVAGGVAVVAGATVYALGVRDRRQAQGGLSLQLGDRGGALVFTGDF